MHRHHNQGSDGGAGDAASATGAATAADEHTVHLRRLRRIRHATQLLDNAFRIPGTWWRIGLDPIIGLIPGAGDLITSSIAIWIVIEAYRMGISRAALARMIGNVAIDFLIGSVPLIGDLFDAAWKCNARNIRILERSLTSLRPPTHT